MANIKGIIVEIGGDTSKLQQALSKVNSATASLNKELRGINSLLKLDPKNTELVAQKQTVLKENIEETTNKLNTLRQAQEKYIESGGELNTPEYRNLQREIINTENKLKNLQAQASKWISAGKSLDEWASKIQNISDKVDNLGNKFTTRLTLPIVGMATAAVKTGNDFEAQMSRVQAIAGATKEELKQLTNQAIDLGAKTSFSASEVAEGMENLASAGFTTNEIMDAMPGLLDLAASSGAQLATASEIAASALRGFGMDASNSAHVADVFAEAAARTNAQTEDMGEAMKYVAPVAKTVGLSIEETAAAIGIMSDAGVKGGQAGTTLRGGLTRIVKPTKQVKEAMDELGVKFYDNNGKMKSLAEIISILQQSTKGLSDETKNQAMAQIFGTEALSGMLALVNRGSDELSAMTKSFEQCDGAAANMAETMLDNTAGSLESLSGSFESAGIVIQKALAPDIKKLAKFVQGLVDNFSDLSQEEQKNIIKNVAFVASIGPAIKIISKLGSGFAKTVKAAGTLTQAIGFIGKTSTTEFAKASKSVQTLTKVFESIPTGLATLAIGALIAGITALAVEAQKSQERIKNVFSGMGEGANNFTSGIENAKSHLDSFNSTLFASSEEQQKLQEDMDNVQKGITEICKRASNERRDYTQQEITQLDQYFAKLKELKDRELEIQQSIGASITQQATQNAQSFQGNLAEYQAQSKEWIKTAQDQANQEIQIINDRTTQEIALLQQRYGEKATLENEEYAREYNAIIANKETAIQEATDQVGKVMEVYNNGYTERAQKEEEWLSKAFGYAQLEESENSRHANVLKQIEDDKAKNFAEKQSAIEFENAQHTYAMNDIWNRFGKDMSEEEAKELGSWMARQATTEMYGGKISDENKKMVDKILGFYEQMPPKTKEAMQNAMSPMLTEMQNKEPSLFAKASGIANGILTRLKKAFDIHSPSRETRKIFNFAMEGMEKGIDDEKNKLYKQIDKFAQNAMDRFSAISLNLDDSNFNIPQIQDFGNLQGALKTQIMEKTNTVFTTPQIVFNVQELDQAKLDQCFNYVNKKFGSKY